jgi:site-specific recombinase XerD
VAPAVAATFRNYLAHRAAVRRSSTIAGERQFLMRFAEYLAIHAPGVTTLSDLRRSHIEAYKRFLTTNPVPPRNRPISQRSIYRHLVLLRSVFNYLAETGREGAPTGRLILPDNLPTQDRALPRFIEDSASIFKLADTDPPSFIPKSESSA